MTDEQKELVYTFQLNVIKAIVNMDVEKTWELMKKAIESEGGERMTKEEAKEYIYDCLDHSEATEVIKALEQESITWIVGKDNCQVAVRNMPIDKMQKICGIIGEEEQVDALPPATSICKELAELLEELQKWRNIREKINALCDTDCDYPEYRSSGTMCDACPIGTVKEYFEQLFDE